MSLPALTVAATRLALPSLGRLFASPAIRGIVHKFGQPGSLGRESRASKAFAPIASAVVKSLGSSGLLGLPTPPAYGLVHGVRFQNPPGSLSRLARGAGYASFLGQTTFSEPRAQGAVSRMFGTVGRLQGLLHDAMSQVRRVIAA